MSQPSQGMAALTVPYRHVPCRLVQQEGEISFSLGGKQTKLVPNKPWRIALQSTAFRYSQSCVKLTCEPCRNQHCTGSARGEARAISGLRQVRSLLYPRKHSTSGQKQGNNLHTFDGQDNTVVEPYSESYLNKQTSPNTKKS